MSAPHPLLEQKKSDIAIIYFCPNDESPANAPEVFKLRYNRQTTFSEVLSEAAYYFGKEPGKMVLKDDNSSQWPLNRRVWQELQKIARAIRLCPVEEEAVDEAAKEVDAVVQEEEADGDDTKPPLPRPPLIRELVIHCIFLVSLIWHSKADNTETALFELHNAMSGAFFQQQFELDYTNTVLTDQTEFANKAIHNVAETRTALDKEDMFGVQSNKQLCGWLDANLRRGLFDTDASGNDASGAIMSFNRVIGGVRFDVTTQPWRAYDEAYEAYKDITWRNVEPDSTSRTEYLRPANITQGWLSNQMIVLESDYSALVDAWCPKEWNSTSTLFNTTSEVLREMQVQVLVYNHNVNMYVMLTFRFLLKYGGSLFNSFSFMPCSFTDEISLLTWGTKDNSIPWSNYILNLKGWLTLVNYILVCTRTYGEVRAAVRIKRKGRPLFWDYFGGIFTLLELFNLTCNYVGMALRLTFSFSTNSDEFLEATLPAANHSDVSSQVNGIVFNAYLYSAIRGVRALSILSAMLLLFKYLELAPRGRAASFYLTGTALSRSGRGIKMVFGFFTFFVLMSAVVGEQLFGTKLREFSSVYEAFFTLSVAVAGFGGTYWNLYRAEPVLGPLFFISFQLSVLVFITPFFLAIINDAYAMRFAALEMLKEKVRKAQADKRKAETQQFGGGNRTSQTQYAYDRYSKPKPKILGPA